MVFGGSRMEQQEEVLTPSYHGESCRHNGDNPNYESDYYLLCFPDWRSWQENNGLDNV